MMPVIVTGTDHVVYHGFSPPVYGAWTQILQGAAPFHYMIGGTTYQITPRPPGTQYYFPYLGPSVPIQVAVGRTVNNGQFY